MAGSSAPPIRSLVATLRSGTSPDESTYPPILSALSKVRDLVANPNAVHGQLLKLGFASDPFTRNALVSAYACMGDSAGARRVFEEGPSREGIAWTALISGMTKNRRPLDGLRLFVAMRREGAPVDAVAVATALAACGAAPDVWFGRCLHGSYVACGRVPLDDVHVGTALVDLYGKCGQAVEARRAFDEMPYRNVVTWTALIACYARCGVAAHAVDSGAARFSGAAWALFCEMLAESGRSTTTVTAAIPNQQTLTSVLGSIANAGSLRKGKLVHGYVYNRDLWASPAVGAALIDMYAKCGCIDRAVDVFHTLPPTSVDAYPWTATITALATHGREREALRLFSVMWTVAPPNAVTYLGVLSACAHGGLVDEGKAYFARMRWVDGIEPSEKHYGCMVDLLARAGRLGEALELIGNMPVEPTPAMWAALSAGCFRHGNLVLGGAVRGRILPLQSGAAGSGWLALLANIYAAGGKWEDTARMRKAMREERVQPAGRSWVEVGGDVHEFTASDASHERVLEVYRALDMVAVESKRTEYDEEDGVVQVSGYNCEYM